MTEQVLIETTPLDNLETELEELEPQLGKILPSLEPEVDEGEPELEPENSRSLTGSIKRRAPYPLVSIKEWRAIRREIDDLSKKARQDLNRIYIGLNDYRLAIIDQTYKFNQVDDEIWSRYDQMLADIQVLEKTTRARPYVFQSQTRLRALCASWNGFTRRQDKFISLLNEAPNALEYYNKIQILRKQRLEEKEKRDQVVRQLGAARRMLEDTIHYVENVNKQGPITQGSRILLLDDVQLRWEDQVNRLRRYEKEGVDNPEEILTRVFKFKESLQDAPVSARRVIALEERFNSLITMHDLLETYGKNIIPQNEIARVTVIMFEKIPKYWISSDRATFERNVNAIESFINYYENKVQAELAIAERRRPGSTRALSTGEEDRLVLPQMTALTRSLINAVDARDRFMRGHSDRVTRLSLQIARKMGWTLNDLEYLEIAALLHDVGKLSIPESILTKMTPLSNEDWSVIQRHPFYGAQIIRPIPPLSRVIPWIYHHQERWDGKGYPDRLAKNEIPTGASIISVAEAFMAVTVDMPNRPAMTKEEALDNLRQEAGKQFSPTIIEVFSDVIDSET
jgi:HD-GYP domain-containing protein (c-di-GMP phosphodiesterase class II)